MIFTVLKYIFNHCCADILHTQSQTGVLLPVKAAACMQGDLYLCKQKMTIEGFV